MINVEQIVRGKDEKPITVSPDALVAEVAEIMTSKRWGVVIVCTEEGHAVGVISWRDIIKAVAEISGDISVFKVSQLLTKNPITCNMEDDIRDVMETMKLNHFQHMPVVQHGNLIGMISISDILKSLIEESDMDKRAAMFSNLEYL